jgi:hypothetical protein
MGDHRKGERSGELCRREASGALTEAERRELKSLIREIEDAEAAYLHGATEQLRSERESVEAQNRSLEALAHRKEALVLRLRTILAEAETEREAIDADLARILGESPRSGRGVGE